MPVAILAASSKSGRLRVARRLLAEGATSQWSARAYEPKNGLERRGLEAAVASGLVVRTEAGTYFVDAERYEALQVRERWTVIVVVTVLALWIVFLYLIGEL